MAKVDLTVKFVESVKPSERGVRTEYFDVKVRGLSLRVSAKGRKSWSLLYSRDGKKIRYTLGSFPVIPLASARESALQILLQAKIGADPSLAKQSLKQAPTAEILVAEYLDKYAKHKKKHWAVDQRLLQKEFLPFFKGRKIIEIQRREIVDRVHEIMNRGAPIQANRVLALLRKLFNFAVEYGLADHSPCFQVKMPAKENRRDRVLSPEEIRLLWRATEGQKSAACIIARLSLLTGQRTGEVKKAEWKDIDEETGWWTFPASKTKNGHPNRVPLTPMIRGILKAMDRSSTWLFPSPSSSGHVDYIHKHLYRITDLYNLNFVPHDIRRTMATMAASIGASREVIRKILNHKDRDVTSIYDRYSYDQEIKDAFMKWERQLQMILREPVAPSPKRLEISAAKSNLNGVLRLNLPGMGIQEIAGATI